MSRTLSGSLGARMETLLTSLVENVTALSGEVTGMRAELSEMKVAFTALTERLESLIEEREEEFDDAVDQEVAHEVVAWQPHHGPPDQINGIDPTLTSFAGLRKKVWMVGPDHAPVFWAKRNNLYKSFATKRLAAAWGEAV